MSFVPWECLAGLRFRTRLTSTDPQRFVTRTHEIRHVGDTQSGSNDNHAKFAQADKSTAYADRRRLKRGTGLKAFPPLWDPEVRESRFRQETREKQAHFAAVIPQALRRWERAVAGGNLCQ